MIFATCGDPHFSGGDSAGILAAQEWHSGELACRTIMINLTLSRTFVLDCHGNRKGLRNVSLNASNGQLWSNHRKHDVFWLIQTMRASPAYKRRLTG